MRASILGSKLENHTGDHAPVEFVAGSVVDREDRADAQFRLHAAEEKVVKFLDDNKSACGVPPQAITQAKAMHANTVKFRDTVCAEGPKPKRR